MQIKSMLIAAAVALGAAASAYAHTEVYSVVLNGVSEAPPNASPATGTATVTFDLDLVTMRVQASFSGLTGNTTAAHIHCCTTDAGAGTVGVATVTPSFTDFPSGVTSGTYDHTFDLTQAGSFNAAFINNNGGTVSGALNALLAGVAAGKNDSNPLSDLGKAYLNIHTTAFPGGEIRGFLQPVPEPGAYVLMLAGLGVLGVALSKRRK